MRAMYGTTGNRFNLGIFQWPVFIAYEAINLCLGALAGFAVVEAGRIAADGGPVAVVFVTAGVTLTISVYGHATIMRMSGVFTVMLATAMAVLAIFVVAHADWATSQRPNSAEQRCGGDGRRDCTHRGRATVMGVSPTTPVTSLPTLEQAVAVWTALGGFIPSVLLGGVGVLAERSST